MSLDRLPSFRDHENEQRRETLWHLVAILSGVLGMAGLAWFAIHRRLRIDALRSDLLTTISHEIKTPVAASKVLLETLEEEELEEELQREYLQLIGI